MNTLQLYLLVFWVQLACAVLNAIEFITYGGTVYFVIAVGNVTAAILFYRARLRLLAGKR